MTGLSVSKVQGELCHHDIHFPYGAIMGQATMGQATVDMALPRVPMQVVSMLILPLAILCYLLAPAALGTN